VREGKGLRTQTPNYTALQSPNSSPSPLNARTPNPEPRTPDTASRCQRQIEIDYDNFWGYIGWSVDEKKQHELREAEEQAELRAAQEAADLLAASIPAVESTAALVAAVEAGWSEEGCAGKEGAAERSGGGDAEKRNVLGDLVVPGQVGCGKRQTEPGEHRWD
jgi:hypothetical protein